MSFLVRIGVILYFDKVKNKYQNAKNCKYVETLIYND